MQQAYDMIPVRNSGIKVLALGEIRLGVDVEAGFEGDLMAGSAAGGGKLRRELIAVNVGRAD